MKLGPDAVRYLHAGNGTPVSRPFHLRWLLPAFCGTNIKAWWSVWACSWPVAAAGMIWWQYNTGATIGQAAAAAALLLSLPGILGPQVSIPVQVDLPATALTLLGCALMTLGHPAQHIAGLLAITAAACIRETAPVWAALWLATPVPLVALLAPAGAHLIRRAGPDPLGDRFQQIADHPIRSSLEHHAGRWRDGWLLIAPWGACLTGLIDPTPMLVVTVVLAYAQLLVATDSVRLYQHAAGPVMAAATASTIPTRFLLLAVAVHLVWWRHVERV